MGFLNRLASPKFVIRLLTGVANTEFFHRQQWCHLPHRSESNQPFRLKPISFSCPLRPAGQLPKHLRFLANQLFFRTRVGSVLSRNPVRKMRRQPVTRRIVRRLRLLNFEQRLFYELAVAALRTRLQLIQVA